MVSQVVYYFPAYTVMEAMLAPLPALFLLLKHLPEKLNRDPRRSG